MTLAHFHSQSTDDEAEKLQKGGQIGFVYVDVLDFC